MKHARRWLLVLAPLAGLIAVRGPVANAARTSPPPVASRDAGAPRTDAGTAPVDAVAPAPNRSDVLVEALHRSGAVPACWNDFLRGEPEAGEVRLTLRVSVDTNGAVTEVLATQPAPPRLIQCSSAALRRVQLPAGPAVTTTTVYHFMPGQFVPVPTAPSTDAGTDGSR